MEAVEGAEETSQFFATDDAKLLLLALRFDPESPINGPADNQISNSIRVPRCLRPSDVELLEEYAGRSDRWSDFVSYHWVRREIQHAFDSDVPVVPVLSGGSLDDWGDLAREMANRHNLDAARGIEDLVSELLR